EWARVRRAGGGDGARPGRGMRSPRRPVCCAASHGRLHALPPGCRWLDPAGPDHRSQRLALVGRPVAREHRRGADQPAAGL
ncbi:MAG: hypothetical protein AVDCRST_MAG59-2677, partial [uncultured Thermomicrobiales bacterium]